MAKTISLHHIVFATKKRKATIPGESNDMLYRYICGILKNKGCFVHGINGVSDHLHILIDLHPTVALATLVKIIKGSTNHWMKETPGFQHFEEWCDGYYAASFGIERLEDLQQYVANQEVHHQSQEFDSELKTLMINNRLRWHPDDCM